MKQEASKTDSIMLNITELKYNQLEVQINEINELISQQKMSMLKQEIFEFSMGVRFLVGDIVTTSRLASHSRTVTQGFSRFIQWVIG